MFPKISICKADVEIRVLFPGYSPVNRAKNAPTPAHREKPFSQRNQPRNPLANRHPRGSIRPNPESKHVWFRLELRNQFLANEKDTL